MPSRALTGFRTADTDILQLWTIHTDLGGSGSGRRRNIEVLNKAAVVLITSIWEAFCEGLATEAAHHIAIDSPDATHVPGKLQAQLAQPLREDKDIRKVWLLADQGWRAQITQNAGQRVSRWNTPKTAQIKALYLDVLGMADVTDRWHWKRSTHESVTSRLDRYIEVRGAIAHGAIPAHSIHKLFTKNYMGLVQRIAPIMDADVGAHVLAITGTAPW